MEGGGREGGGEIDIFVSVHRFKKDIFFNLLLFGNFFFNFWSASFHLLLNLPFTSYLFTHSSILQISFWLLSLLRTDFPFCLRLSRYSMHLSLFGSHLFLNLSRFRPFLLFFFLFLARHILFYCHFLSQASGRISALCSYWCRKWPPDWNSICAR